MYAENRGADSDDERPPEMTIPTGSCDDVCVLFFIIDARSEVRPRNGRGRALLKAPMMPAGSKFVSRCADET